MKLTRAAVVAGILAGITACATINAPEGGPKDLTPPTLQSSSPQDQQLNVQTKTIRLVFDEEVQQDNLLKELLITPTMNNRYEVRSDKTELTLEFEEPLPDSTTFTFNFREGIVDITEKNVAQGLKISFSTGSFIDSSSVSGKVVNLLKQTPEKGAVVALYQAEDTMNFRKHRPYYLANTDSAGSFEIENIKEGSYRIYALVDKNSNSFYDNEDERVAYLTEPIRILPGTDSVLLQTVRIDTKKPILLQREKFLDRFIANYNEGIQQFVSTPASSKADTIVHRVSADGKAVEMFKTAGFGGGKAILAAVDSAGNITADTIDIAFEGKRAQRVKGAQLKVMNTASGSGYRAGQPVTLVLETPVKITGNAPVTLMADTVVFQQLTYPEQLSLDKTGTELRFTLPKVGDRVTQLEIVLDSTAIVPLVGDPLSFSPISLPVAEAGGTGSITGAVITENESYIVQLLNSEYKVVEERKNPQQIVFKDLEPGPYRIRVMVDENNNGKFEKGDPEMKRLPEKVYIYPEVVDVRAGWEREDINLEF
ncbi:Ig-like domain-containing protein [Pontibacter russatus]|uniref:Ig-like domain-containing protein n=1 Tax=Pontibacter russatus TaxID=2694929 RepID=UPI00137AD7F7|nr:Ig-like domain-containing protein [Pontibacter russatus]